jgi:stage II sporulation protein D
VVEARVQNSGILLINELPLEDYVAGVLPAEMPESFPLEALKAQAVTIRTYALRNKGKHSSTGCDVCDTTHCEVYAGIVDGKPQCRKAVTDTAGVMLTYGGEPAHVFFSADGGGSTQNYADNWPRSNLPYLRGVRDPEGVPHTQWEKTVTLAELAGLLTRGGVKEAENLQAIRAAEVAATGRVLSLEIASPSGTAKVLAGKLRDAVGLDQIRSTLFTVQTSADGVVKFTGKGYGHGIGLCQIGAKGLAQKPHNYKWEQILAHYFPGTSITSGSTSRVTQAPPVVKPALPRILPRAVSAPKTAPPPGKTAVPVAQKKPEGQLTFDVRLVDPDLP